MMNNIERGRVGYNIKGSNRSGRSKRISTCKKNKKGMTKMQYSVEYASGSEKKGTENNIKREIIQNFVKYLKHEHVNMF